jgi:hypothetical protein
MRTAAFRVRLGLPRPSVRGCRSSRPSMGTVKRPVPSAYSVSNGRRGVGLCSVGAPAQILVRRVKGLRAPLSSSLVSMAASSLFLPPTSLHPTSVGKTPWGRESRVGGRARHAQLGGRGTKATRCGGSSVEKRRVEEEEDIGFLVDEASRARFKPLSPTLGVSSPAIPTFVR